MPPVILSAVVDLAKIKMKWKEAYVSEGLNRKVIPSTPRGIYSGLRMIQNITSPRQVEVSSSPDGVHAAVHQSATGFSTTYHDVAGGSTILNLSSASLDNQETVIVLQINYSIGADTTANWIAYPIADWNALTDAQRAERIVLGTVNVPAPATNITTSMILPNRRTVAWDGVSPGAVAWTPVVKNGDFEYSLDDGTFKYAASYWQYSSHTNGQWKVQSVDPYAGIRALAFNQLIAAAPVIWIDQYIGIPAVAGQLIRYKFRVKNLKVPTGGALTFDLLFSDTSFGAGVSIAVSVPMTGIDASYRLIEGVVAAPATASQLYSVRFTNLLNQSSTGIAFRLDDVQVWIETGTARKAPSAEEQTRQQLNTQSVIVESGDDPLADYFGPAALLSMPINDELWLTRRDGDVTVGNPVQLALRTSRVSQLGADLLNTEARALLPRIQAGVSIVGGVDFTLMWESVPTGQPGRRTYVSSTGVLLETVNAAWNGTVWNKDLAGTKATMVSLNRGYVEQFGRVSDAAWTVWTQISKMSVPSAITSDFAPLLEVFDSDGSRRVVVDHLGLRGGAVLEFQQTWGEPFRAAWTENIVGTATNGVSTGPTKLAQPVKWLSVSSNGDQAYGGENQAVILPTFGVIDPHTLAVLEVGIDATDITGLAPATFQFGWVGDIGAPLWGTANDGVMIEKTSVSANWFFRTRASSPAGTNVIDTGIAVSSTLPHRIRIELQGASAASLGAPRALLFIDGVLAATSTTNLPNNGAVGLRAKYQLTKTAAGGSDTVYLTSVRYRIRGMYRVAGDDAL